MKKDDPQGAIFKCSNLSYLGLNLTRFNRDRQLI